MTDATDDFELLTPDARTDPDWKTYEPPPFAEAFEEIAQEANQKIAHWESEYDRAERQRQEVQRRLRDFERCFEVLYWLKEKD